MKETRLTPSTVRLGACLIAILTATSALETDGAGAIQGLTGTLLVKVTDEQGAAIPGARVRVASPALIGGPNEMKTGDDGTRWIPNLTPGPYTLDIEMAGFALHHEEDIRVGAGASLAKVVVLKVGATSSATVEVSATRSEVRDSGFETRFGPDYFRAIPTPRYSFFPLLRAAPGISPTSPTSSTVNTVSAFGGGVNENLFLIDGTNYTCPCQGVSRAEPSVDVIQEIQIQSLGASAEFGNIQGGVINVVTKQGGNRYSSEVSYYGQLSGLTSQPVLLPVPATSSLSGYERVRYRDFTANLGGPVRFDRLWFFAAYQYLRDHDSQPGADPGFPRTYEQDKVFGKLTWRPKPNLRLITSFHDEFWVSPQTPTLVTPFEATQRQHAHVPTMTFGHFTHELSPNTMWDLRVGRFVYSRKDDPSTGDLTTPNRSDRLTRVNIGAPQLLGELTLLRTTGKATLTHYRPELFSANHVWKIGTEIEKGEHRQPHFIPTGTRFVDDNGQPFQSISRGPATTGGQFLTAAVFATDAITIEDRITVNAGVRFDYSRAISQDLPSIDLQGRKTGEIVQGLGTLYTWAVVSPRLGIAVSLGRDGRTRLRGGFGRFHQGVLTGEVSQNHPGLTPITTKAFDSATGGYTRLISVVDPKVNLLIDPDTRPPRTDEYSIGIDREFGAGLSLASAYIHKNGSEYIAWTDVGGQYREEMRTMPDGRSVPVRVLVNSASDRRFLVTNPDGYSMSYNGLVIAGEKRLSHGWLAFASYTYSRVSGLQSNSATTPGGAQLSTIASFSPNTFGQDPNDLTNARGRLPNDRPHIFRVMGKTDVPWIGSAIAANFQYFSGKPWAATTQISLPQGDRRILLEPRGSRRLSPQALLDLRFSRTIFARDLGRVELLVDVFNVLNDTAEEELASDNLYSPNFGRPVVFADPRRAMIGVRLSLGGL